MTSRASLALSSGSAASGMSLEGCLQHPTSARPCRLPQTSSRLPLTQGHTKLSNPSYQTLTYSCSPSHTCEACSLVSSKPGPLSLEPAGRLRQASEPPGWFPCP